MGKKEAEREIIVCEEGRRKKLLRWEGDYLDDHKPLQFENQ